MDLIKREDAIKAIVERFMMNRSYAERMLEDIPSAEPKQEIYGNEHNCIMTMFGECSYNETGCGSCAVVEKVREALAVEPKQGEWIYARQQLEIVPMWECSYCMVRMPKKFNFCPNCGARMKGADDE